MFRSVIICSLLASIAAFHNVAKNVRNSQTIVRAEQEIKDLNLEEMFEVFDKVMKQKKQYQLSQYIYHYTQ